MADFIPLRRYVVGDTSEVRTVGDDAQLLSWTVKATNRPGTTRSTIRLVVIDSLGRLLTTRTVQVSGTAQVEEHVEVSVPGGEGLPVKFYLECLLGDCTASAEATDSYNLLLEETSNAVVIADVEDFGAENVTDTEIRLLPDTVYEIVGADVNIGDRTIIVPTTGETLVKGGATTNTLRREGVGDLFSLTPGSANFIVESITLTCPGGTALVVSCLGNSTSTAFRVRFIGCQKVASFDNMAAVGLRVIQAIGCSEGITISGPQGIVFLTDGLADNNLGTYTHLTVDDTVNAETLTIVRQSVNTTADQTMFNFSSSATITGRARVNRNIFRGDGTPLTGGVDRTSQFWLFTENEGILSSLATCDLSLDSPATTVITVQGQFESVSGSFTLDPVSQRFLHSANALVTYDGQFDVEASLTVMGSLSQSAGAPRDLHIRIRKNGTTTLSTLVLTATSAAKEVFADESLVPLTKDDTIEIEIANADGTENITVHSLHLLIAGVF